MSLKTKYLTVNISLFCWPLIVSEKINYWHEWYTSFVSKYLKFCKNNDDYINDQSSKIKCHKNTRITWCTHRFVSSISRVVVNNNLNRLFYSLRNGKLIISLRVFWSKWVRYAAIIYWNLYVIIYRQSAKSEPRLCELLHSTYFRGFQIPGNLVAVVAL